MPLSASDHLQVQQLIDAASAADLNELRVKAEATLARINTFMGQGILSKEDHKAGEIAIEILMRIEATELGKGWWFRTKRRVQLTQMYLGR